MIFKSFNHKNTFTLAHHVQLAARHWHKSTLCSMLALISINLINYGIIWQAEGYANLILTQRHKTRRALQWEFLQYPAATAICADKRADDFSHWEYSNRKINNAMLPMHISTATGTCSLEIFLPAALNVNGQKYHILASIS